MKEYSEDTSNLIYYDKEAMEESIRITDLKFAKEEGLDEGFNLGEKNGKLKQSINMAKKMLKDGLDIESISKYSELSKKEILKLQNN